MRKLFLPELLSIQETVSMKLSKFVHEIQAHGSMEAKNILKKFALPEKKKKRKKNESKHFTTK